MPVLVGRLTAIDYEHGTLEVGHQPVHGAGADWPQGLQIGDPVTLIYERRNDGLWAVEVRRTVR